MDSNAPCELVSVLIDKKDLAIEETLLDPMNYILRNPGKQFRSLLMQAFNTYYQVPDDYLEKLCVCTEALHNASLLMDDIEDSSDLRRGNPAAHKVFGTPFTINTACFIYGKVLEWSDENLKEGSHKILHRRFVQAHKGQGMDIYWRDNVICPTEEEYMQMIANKTTALFCCGFDLMAHYSECKIDFEPFINKLGQFFQIRDDYANLCFDEYTESKSFAEDVTEGKFSYPLIYAIQKNPKDKTILNIIKQRTTDLSLKKFAVKHLEEVGALKATKDKLEQLKIELKNEMAKFDKNEAVESLLHMLYLKDEKSEA